MQLGFVSAIVPDLSLQEVLTAASQIGYDCIELMCWPVGAAERRYAGVTHVGCATNEHLHRPQPLVQFAEQCNVRIEIENCPLLFSSGEWPDGKNLAISPEVWRGLFDDPQ